MKARKEDVIKPKKDKSSERQTFRRTFPANFSGVPFSLRGSNGVHVQQQPPLLFPIGVEEESILTLGFGFESGAGPIRFLISAAMVINAWDTESVG